MVNVKFFFVFIFYKRKKKISFFVFWKAKNNVGFGFDIFFFVNLMEGLLYVCSFNCYTRQFLHMHVCECKQVCWICNIVYSYFILQPNIFNTMQYNECCCCCCCSCGDCLSTDLFFYRFFCYFDCSFVCINGIYD